MSRGAAFIVVGLVALSCDGCTLARTGSRTLDGRAPDGRTIHVRVLSAPPAGARLLPLVWDEKNAMLSVSAQPPGARKRHDYMLRPRSASERSSTAAATWSDTATGPEICFPRKVGAGEITYQDGSIPLEVYDYCALLGNNQ